MRQTLSGISKTLTLPYRIRIKDKCHSLFAETNVIAAWKDALRFGRLNALMLINPVLFSLKLWQ